MRAPVRSYVHASLPDGDYIDVDVAYYDQTQRLKLSKFPTANVMDELVKSPVRIPMSEFLTYYLFHRQRLRPHRYGGFSQISASRHIASAQLQDVLEFSHSSMRLPTDVETPLVEATEHVGESIGLSIVGRIHGMTEADWRPIPAQGGEGALPAFDFEYGSDGNVIVEIETKGSAVTDNRLLLPAVRQQKARIERKKITLTAVDGHAPSKRLRYGTIVVLDRRPTGNVRCWLTDPPPLDGERDPRSFRLLQRMRFLRDWISLIAPRSQIAASLSTRTSSLDNLRSPFELDGVRLRKGDGEAFLFSAEPYSSFFGSRSRVQDGPAGGVVVRHSNRSLFFLGIREELLSLAADQDFQRISGYSAQAATIPKVVECVVSIGRFRTLQIPGSVSVTRSGGYMMFSLKGKLHYSRGGLVFGELPFPEE